MSDKLSVLRECYRVLKPAGHMAGYVIHTPGGLTPDEVEHAAELGPSDVSAPGTPDELARSVGFEVITYGDVTAEFRRTCAALLRARIELEADLRAEEGDDFFEEERGKKESMLAGIDEGVLRRSLISVIKTDLTGAHPD